tara:strand:- start:938 stop:1417 length:480 start_codon:yes stop_codon:yes gene_type:complete
MKGDNLLFAEIDDQNVIVFENLAQAYEAEFSTLTQKVPNKLGVFKIDVNPLQRFSGYLVYDGNIPIGFSVVDVESSVNDILEFYIIPSMRHKKYGYALAAMVFDKHPGAWQVRQIKGADDATSFWRRVIKKYTNDRFKEQVITDATWGEVTCQQFKSMG